jgi:hypothetical protein
MPMASWLFIRGQESVWVERPHGFTLIVAGPGPAREEHEFRHEQQLEAYQVALAERLTSGGWFLWAFDRERRQGLERRQSVRTSPDRRQKRHSRPPTTETS